MKLRTIILIFATPSSVSISAQTLSLYHQGLVALQQNRPAEALVALTAWKEALLADRAHFLSSPGMILSTLILSTLLP